MVSGRNPSLSSPLVLSTVVLAARTGSESVCDRTALRECCTKDCKEFGSERRGLAVVHRLPKQQIFESKRGVIFFLCRPQPRLSESTTSEWYVGIKFIPIIFRLWQSLDLSIRLKELVLEIHCWLSALFAKP